jgi:dipeptide/tripeptide permease
MGANYCGGGVDKERPGIMQFAGLGLMNALCWVAGLAGGWFADQALGTLPLFLFLGLVLGIGIGVWASRAELKRFF